MEKERDRCMQSWRQTWTHAQGQHQKGLLPGNSLKLRGSERAAWWQETKSSSNSRHYRAYPHCAAFACDFHSFPETASFWKTAPNNPCRNVCVHCGDWFAPKWRGFATPRVQKTHITDDRSWSRADYRVTTINLSAEATLCFFFILSATHGKIRIYRKSPTAHY
jgi:hypothetical protein